VKLDACGAPRHCQVVGVVNEEVRSASAAVVVGHDTNVDLHAVPRGEAVATSRVGTDGEAESLVVLHRRIEVMHGEDRR
jgi:folate-dependent tRNA-U54 methylase TrmFO/GidA